MGSERGNGTDREQKVKKGQGRLDTSERHRKKCLHPLECTGMVPRIPESFLLPSMNPPGKVSHCLFVMVLTEYEGCLSDDPAT